jgi:hypothetical protein
MIDVDSLTIGQLKELRALLGGDSATTQPPHPYEIGKVHFIRTVTHHFTGKLVAVFPQELVFEDVAWIADDGRLATALVKGEFNEVEPYPDGRRVVIGRGSLIDAHAVEWVAPRSQR